LWILSYRPDECAKRSACVFNLGAFGYCLCHEHYSVRHGTEESRRAYYLAHPERRGGAVAHIEDDRSVRQNRVKD